MNIGVIFAGGSGRRMHTAGTPKQFLEVGGKPIIVHTLEKFEQCEDVDAVVVACLESHITVLRKLVSRYALTKTRCIVPGGSSGQKSIYNGLCAARKIAEEDDYPDQTVVLVHDGVRPLVTAALLSENIRKARKYGNAITVAPAIETIFQYDGNTREVLQIFDRSTCYVAKAPQTFFLKDILTAHEKAREQKREFIDSASLMMACGTILHTVESSRDNIKVTTPSDYYLLKAILQEKEQSDIFGIYTV